MTVKIYILKAYSYFLAGFDWHFSNSDPESPNVAKPTNSKP